MLCFYLLLAYKLEKTLDLFLIPNLLYNPIVNVFHQSSRHPSHLDKRFLTKNHENHSIISQQPLNKNFSNFIFKLIYILYFLYFYFK